MNELLKAWADALRSNDLPRAIAAYDELRRKLEAGESEPEWGKEGLPTKSALYGWGLMRQKVLEQQAKSRVEVEADYAAGYERLQAIVAELGKAAKVRDVIRLVGEAKNELAVIVLNAAHLGD